MVVKPKKRKCSAQDCNNTFQQFDSLTRWCSPGCGYKIAKANLEIKRRKDRVKVKKERLLYKKKVNENDKKWCRKKAKEELHRWVVYVRDAGMPCISCGNRNPNIKYDAGHYRSVGSALHMEMLPENIHKQCSVNCNQHLSSNRSGYDKGLVERYGKEYLDYLKSYQESPRYRAADYLAIRDKYRELNRSAGVLPYQKYKK